MSQLLHEVAASSEPGTPELETRFAAHCCIQRRNHSEMTQTSKTDWQQLSGITHWLQQRVDSEQGRFSTELLSPGTLTVIYL